MTGMLIRTVFIRTVFIDTVFTQIDGGEGS